MCDVRIGARIIISRLNIKETATGHIGIRYSSFDCIPQVSFLGRYKSRLIQFVHKNVKNTNTTLIYLIII